MTSKWDMMMALLIEPDETPNIEVTVEYAIELCRTHPGWSWALKNERE